MTEGAIVSTDSETTSVEAQWEWTWLLDIALIALIPIVLSVVYALPEPTRAEYIFAYSAPSVQTAFVSSFVHFDLTHLGMNLIGYALVVPYGYLMSVSNGRRNMFFVAFLTFVLAFPIALSYMNLVMIRSGASAGFSGLLLAFYGYLPLAIAEHLETRFDIGHARDSAPMLFCLGTVVIVGLTLWSVLTQPVTVPVEGRSISVNAVLSETLVGLAVASLLSALLFGLSTIESAATLRVKIGQAVDTASAFELSVVGVFLLLAFPFATFPVDPTLTGGVLNLYVHLMGYALGFIATYSTFQFDQYMSDE